MRRAAVALQVIRRVTGEKDRRGNPVVSWAAPETVMVYGVASRNRDEPFEQGRNEAISTIWDVYAPLGVEISPYDRVQLPHGEQCEVVGEVGVWDHNPHVLAHHTGVQFTVQRRQG